MLADVDEWVGPRPAPALRLGVLIGVAACIVAGAYVIAIGAVAVITFLMATTSPELGSLDQSEVPEFSPEAIAVNDAISARHKTLGSWVAIQPAAESNWNTRVVELGGALEGSILSVSVHGGGPSIGSKKRPVAFAVISRGDGGYLVTSNSLPQTLRAHDRHAYDTQASLSDLIAWHTAWTGTLRAITLSHLTSRLGVKLTDRDRFRYAARWPIFALKAKAIVG